VNGTEYEVIPRFNGGSGGATVKITSNGRLFRRRELVEFALDLLQAAALPGILDEKLCELVKVVGAAPDRAVLPVTKEP
jgi:hypothetical protein